MAASLSGPSWAGWGLDYKTRMVKGIWEFVPLDLDESGPQEARTLTPVAVRGLASG